MCGICGVLDIDGTGRTTLEQIEAMAQTLIHRGPDDEGYHVKSPIALGFRRLSIVDLKGGHQPMSNEDGSIWIVCNGEIYNHAELRVDLERRGHHYASHSDTETIVHLYEQWGDDCVLHLRGMFAFAIWDSRKKRLFCARDRLGIKPFYHSMDGRRFAFASEMKALFELPWLRPRMNRRALPEFFALGYLSGVDTMFHNVSRLLPGCRLSLDLTGPCVEPRIERYWDLPIAASEAAKSEADYIARFREMFTQSVQLRLMSDVPLGVFLSGGLDSSCIAAVTASLAADRVKTFSIGYAEDRFSELPFARRVAEHIGTEHHEISLGPQEFLDSLPRLIWHEDEPIVWPSSVALYFVSRLAADKVKVVLSGEGADELFAGYMKYPATVFNIGIGSHYEKLVPASVRRRIRNALSNPFFHHSVLRKLRHSFLNHSCEFREIYLDNFHSVFPQDTHARLFTPQVGEELRNVDPYATSMVYFRSDCSGYDLLKSLLCLDIKTYLSELLMKQDQMSMAASIESRVPFLDHELVEFALGVPSKLKVRFLSGKSLLRRAMEDRLPREAVGRHKMGFPTPVKPWTRYQLFSQIANILTDGRLSARGLLNPGFVRDLLETHRSGRVDCTDAIWRLLNFELWNRIFFDRDPIFATQFDRTEQKQTAVTY